MDTINQTNQVTVTQDTEYTKRMKENFSFFGPVTFLYAVFYAFCMFHNGSGITFPFFVAGSLFYLCFCLSKLEISLKKDSMFYMVSMMLLGVSAFCTDDTRIVAFNKTGIFLLMMSLLLHQFYDTSKWRLGKYLGSILTLVCCSLGELGCPFSDCAAYYKEKDRKNKTLCYIIIGMVIAVPLLLVVTLLLSGADAIFREMTNHFFESINVGNIVNVAFRIMFLFFAAYLLVSFLCKKSIKEDVKERRNGEPILAITVTGLLSVIYLLFSGIQIIYLFMGRMQLPEGYTYAMYAREGFFQLLLVSMLNLVIVLVCMTFFKESKTLKIIMTIMSFCTFIMIASSALRMIIYVQYYFLTFLRVMVLWGLAVLFLLFVGVVISIYKEDFGLFRYSMIVVTVLYTMFSFSHPDYIVARVNVESMNEESIDFAHLTTLSADAAPVILSYMDELGYELSDFNAEDPFVKVNNGEGKYDETGFGYFYLARLVQRCDDLSLRTFNVSRYIAMKQLAQYTGEE